MKFNPSSFPYRSICIKNEEITERNKENKIKNDKRIIYEIFDQIKDKFIPFSQRNMGRRTHVLNICYSISNEIFPKIKILTFVFV